MPPLHSISHSLNSAPARSGGVDPVDKPPRSARGEKRPKGVMVSGKLKVFLWSQALTSSSAIVNTSQIGLLEKSETVPAAQPIIKLAGQECSLVAQQWTRSGKVFQRIWRVDLRYYVQAVENAIGEQRIQLIE